MTKLVSGVYVLAEVALDFLSSTTAWGRPT